MPDENLARSFHVNPLEVEYSLERATFRYPKNHEASFGAGWGHMTVIPALFGLMVRLNRFPYPDEGVKFLLDNARDCSVSDSMIINRGRKLYLDFAREVHTLGLLQSHPKFGYVIYQAILDTKFNVDFVASLLSSVQNRGGDSVGIQSSMRSTWWPTGYTDPYDQIKKARRKRRGVTMWEGEIYFLTNRTRRHAKAIASCWLFGENHIEDLIEEICGSSDNSKSIGVQLGLFDE